MISVHHLLTYILIVSLPFSLVGQSCKKKYKSFVNPEAQLIDCGYNYTVEKLPNEQTIFKRYYPQNKVITNLVTFKTDNFKVLHGKFEERGDDGRIIQSGHYKDNVKIGHWIENFFEQGSYYKGYRHGVWTYCNADSSERREYHYEFGELHGDYIEYDAYGHIKSTIITYQGQILELDSKITQQNKIVPPIFPGCEEVKVMNEAIKECTHERLSHFIKRKIKIPFKLRRHIIQGKLFILFTVQKNGTITNIDVVNAITKEFKKDILKTLEELPKFYPAQSRGNPIDFPFQISIYIKINSFINPEETK